MQQEVAQLRLHAVELAFEALHLVAEARDLGEERCRVLALAFRDADLLRRALRRDCSSCVRIWMSLRARFERRRSARCRA